MSVKFPYLKKEELDQEQRRFWDFITLGERGFYTGGAAATRLPDLYNAWLQFVPLGVAATGLGDEVRKRSALPGKLRELVVLFTSARLGARVEFDFHTPFALDQGLSTELIEAIGRGERPEFQDDAERIVYEANMQLIGTGDLSSGTKRELVDLLGFNGMMQFVAAVSLYVINAYTTNIANVKLAEDFSADPDKLKRHYAGGRKNAES